MPGSIALCMYIRIVVRSLGKGRTDFMSLHLHPEYLHGVELLAQLLWHPMGLAYSNPNAW
jgi:hypothetical protein